MRGYPNIRVVGNLTEKYTWNDMTLTLGMLPTEPLHQSVND